jgi:hypothetical protein
MAATVNGIVIICAYLVILVYKVVECSSIEHWHRQDSVAYGDFLWLSFKPRALI